MEIATKTAHYLSILNKDTREEMGMVVIDSEDGSTPDDAYIRKHIANRLPFNVDQIAWEFVDPEVAVAKLQEKAVGEGEKTLMAEYCPVCVAEKGRDEALNMSSQIHKLTGMDMSDAHWRPKLCREHAEEAREKHGSYVIVDKNIEDEKAVVDPVRCELTPDPVLFFITGSMKAVVEEKGFLIVGPKDGLAINAVSTGIRGVLRDAYKDDPKAMAKWLSVCTAAAMASEIFMGAFAKAEAKTEPKVTADSESATLH